MWRSQKRWIVWDGYVDEEKMIDGSLPDDLRLCVTDAQVVNADAPNGFSSPHVADSALFDCTLEPRPAVELDL